MHYNLEFDFRGISKNCIGTDIIFVHIHVLSIEQALLKEFPHIILESHVNKLGRHEMTDFDKELHVFQFTIITVYLKKDQDHEVILIKGNYVLGRSLSDCML